MKKLFTILLLLLCFLTCGCTSNKPKSTLDLIKEKDILTAGVKFDSKPFGFIENNEIKGLDIDIAKHIAKNILGDKNKIKFVEVTSENRIAKLINGDIDIIVATMTDTQDRRKIVDFSIPYYVSGQVILCQKNSDIKSAANLSYNNTVIVKGTTAEKTFKQFHNKSNVIKAHTYHEAFNAINNNTCMIGDEAILQGFLQNNQGYQIFNKKLSSEPYAVAIRKEDTTLKKYIDFTIEQLQNSDELDKIKNKWIK